MRLLLIYSFYAPVIGLPKGDRGLTFLFQNVGQCFHSGAKISTCIQIPPP